MPEILTYDDAIKWYAKCMRVSEREARDEAEALIAQTMQDEKCPREFAENTFIEDTAEMTPDELDAAEKAAKDAGVMKHQAKAVDAYGKKRTREHKPDDDKRALMDRIAFAFDGFDDVNVINPERELTLTYGGNQYRITLAKVRGPNKKKKG